MNAERLEIARRLVACPKWVWIPGLSAVGSIRVGRYDLVASHRVTMVDEHGPWTTTGRRVSASGSRSRHAIIEDPVPDLDDDLTRLGVLAVVRRAWEDDEFSAACMPDGEWIADGQFVKFNGPTEEAALLAALEAAPA